MIEEQIRTGRKKIMAKKKLKRLVKGSKEAKAFMTRLRAKRKKKGKKRTVRRKGKRRKSSRRRLGGSGAGFLFG